MFARLLLCLILTASMAPAATHPTQEGYLEVGPGIKVFYQRFGQGEKKIIIPGRMLLVENFKVLANDFDVVMYDMRNRGKSTRVEDGKALTIEHDVQDIEAVRRHFGFNKINLSGYSYLGKVVVLYAMEHPERVERIVQIGPVPMKFGTKYDEKYAVPQSPELEAKWKELDEAKKRNEHINMARQFCERQWQVVRLWLVGDPKHADRLGKSQCDMENELPVNFERHLKYNFVESGMKHSVPWEQVVAVVKHPVLTVHGTLDRNAPYGAGREWAERLPNARLLTVKGAAHQVFAEYPEIVLPAIKTFFKGDWPKQAEVLKAQQSTPGK
jgi:proline iminopeptidase